MCYFRRRRRREQLVRFGAQIARRPIGATFLLLLAPRIRLTAVARAEAADSSSSSRGGEPLLATTRSSSFLFAWPVVREEFSLRHWQQIKLSLTNGWPGLEQPAKSAPTATTVVANNSERKPPWCVLLFVYLSQACSAFACASAPASAFASCRRRCCWGHQISQPHNTQETCRRCCSADCIAAAAAAGDAAGVAALAKLLCMSRLAAATATATTPVAAALFMSSATREDHTPASQQQQVGERESRALKLSNIWLPLVANK